MDKPKLNRDFFAKKRKELLQLLEPQSTAFVVSTDQLPRNGDQTFPFRQNSDLFYLTGIDQEQTILALCPEHPNPAYREVLFIRRSSKQTEVWEGHKLTQEEAKEISGINNIHWFDTFESILPELMYYSQNIYISENSNFRYQRFYDDSYLRFIKRLQFLYPLHNYKRLSNLITKLRLIKSKEELDVIKYAIELTNQAFLRVLKFVRPGVCECEIEAEITHEFIKNGVRNHAYMPIIASGKDNNVLHYIFNNKVCQENDLVLMDFGAEYLNYAADLTRTVPVSGRFSKRQKQVYNAVLDIQQQMIKSIKPGQTINRINKEADRLTSEKLIELGLIDKNEVNEPEKIKKYFPHGLSHFMGLDVHDVGTKDTQFEPGMVITVEPGIYIEEEGFGVRIENDILITEQDTEDLMKNIPSNSEEIELLMNA